MTDFTTGVELVQEFIDPAVFILVPTLWFFGVMLKHTPKVPDWTIVWALVILGVALSAAFIGFNAYGLVQGVLTTAMAVLGYDLFKETKKGIDN